MRHAKSPHLAGRWAAPKLRSTRVLRSLAKQDFMSAAARTTKIDTVRHEAVACRRCGLWRNATQTVFGEGPANAELMLVGEQPGDKEDIAGHPFVGPAGAVLDRALKDAKIPRSEVYVTNAVKHFKSIPRGKRRIHQRPNNAEIEACRWWLTQELKLVAPGLVVALGVSAARALLGRLVTISKTRQTLLEGVDGEKVAVTSHPSAILRMIDEAARHEAYELLVKDLAWADQQRRALGKK